MSSGNGAIYVDDDLDLPSESDDEEERLDCVHDIHGDGDEADAEDEVESQDKVLMYHQNNQLSKEEDSDSQLETERRNGGNDSSMDGDIEDADGMDTERMNR